MADTGSTISEQLDDDTPPADDELARAAKWFRDAGIPDADAGHAAMVALGRMPEGSPSHPDVYKNAGRIG